jgi:DNA-binding GntR family transcriptional regulator
MCRAAKGALSLVTQGPDSNSEHTRVYRSLKVVTINYLFRPGEQLMIGELAERLRVSSTSVRETLIRLQAESLLDTTPRRGFFAKTLSIKEMVDLFQFRFLILKSAIEQTSGGTDDRSLSVAPPLVLQPSEVSETPSTTVACRYWR